MSKHTFEVSTRTGARAWLVMGYDCMPAPRFFCMVLPYDELMAKPLWDSNFSLEHMAATEVTEFDEPLANLGITVPPFIQNALREDWVKGQLNCDYYWHPDGTIEQTL